MRSIPTACAIALLLPGFIQPAMARPAKAASVTEQDVRACMGVGGVGASAQVAACTKVLSSGKIKRGHEAPFYAYRSGAAFTLRQDQQALDDINKAVSMEDTPEYRFQRALVRMARGEPADATTDLDAVMRAKPDFAPAWFMRGMIHYRAGSYGDATTAFDKAVTLLPTYYQAIYARGSAKIRGGDAAGGRADIATAKGMSAHAEADAAKLGLVPPSETAAKD